MLRAIPPMFESQFPGVMVMGAAIAVLFVMPWLDRSPVKSMRYKGSLSKIWLTIFTISFVVLGYLGTVPSGALGQLPLGDGETLPIATLLARICTALYFCYFASLLIVPYFEKTKSVPERVTG